MEGLKTFADQAAFSSPRDRDVAGHVIAFLEDRRVLYNPYEVEIPEECVKSVILIRERLTNHLGERGVAPELAESLRAMRAACRKFLNSGPGGSWAGLTRPGDALSDPLFNQALGELRGVFGIHIGILAVTYELDVEDDLAQILPLADSQTAGRPPES
jgi:hypothetical protein